MKASQEVKRGHGIIKRSWKVTEVKMRSKKVVLSAMNFRCRTNLNSRTVRIGFGPKDGKVITTYKI